MRGASILEIIIVIGIVALIGVALGSFQGDIFYLNSVIQNGLSADEQARTIIRPMLDEIRSAQQSSLGAYPIKEAAPSSFTFYADINGDGLVEQVRYFATGTSFKKGVIIPSGNPLVYATSTETVTTLVSSLGNGTSSVFEYYDSSYNGSATSTPLVQPVSLLAVRLVKITLKVDVDSNRSPTPRLITTQVQIRNLKDNL